VNVRTSLHRFMRAVLEEADRNPAFDAALQEALGGLPPKTKDPKTSKMAETSSGEPKRAKNRRAPAAFDPVHIVRSGEAILRQELSKLNIEQLKDLVSEYGMDPGRLVVKWTDPTRFIDKIVELSLSRAHKGDAFRRPTEEPGAVRPAEPPKPTS
jgi:hypothetical protein